MYFACGLAFLLIIAQESQLANLPYLFQRLKSPPYKSSFHALFKVDKPKEAWLKKCLKDNDGVFSRGSVGEVNGTKLEFYFICKPHDCTGNGFIVAFRPGGTEAWALLTSEAKVMQYFGNPNFEIKSALRNFAKQENALS